MFASAVVPFVGLPNFTSHVVVVDLGNDLFEIVSDCSTITLRGSDLGNYIDSLPHGTKVEHQSSLDLC